MEYYLKLIENIQNVFMDLIDCINGTESYGGRILLGLYVYVNIVLVTRILKITNAGKDTRVGTGAFWIVLSILTGGIGGVILIAIDKVCPNRVFKRPFHSIGYLVFPTLVTLLLSVASYYQWIEIEIDYSLALLGGILSFFVEYFIIFFQKQNRRMSIVLGRPQSIQEDAWVIGNNVGIREKIQSGKDGRVTVRIRDADVPFVSISQKELDKYLLIGEYRTASLIRKYIKANGETFCVLELESLVPAKLCSSLAGLMILIGLTTPYIPIALQSVLHIFNRG